MMKVTSPGRGTSNKWRYVQPETGVVFTGFSYWQVFNDVSAHRNAMGLDLAEGWEDRFQDDLCKQNEQVPCTGRKADVSKRHLQMADLQRFFALMASWKGDTVPQEEAERRAVICSTCPLNVTVQGCWGCAGMIKKVVSLVGNKQTSRDSALESCKVCGCVLRAKVWLPLAADGLEYPSHCWQATAPASSGEE